LRTEKQSVEAFSRNRPKVSRRASLLESYVEIFGSDQSSMHIVSVSQAALTNFPGMRTIALAFGLMALTAGPAQAASLDAASQLLKSGQHAKALDEVDGFLASKPKDPQGRFLKGIILTGLNKQNEAITVFKKLTEDYPELPEPYNNLAVIYAQQKQYDKAKEALEKAIRTHPAYATAHENLGDIYTRLASQAYGKALQFDSANASAQTKLSMISELVGSGTAGSGAGNAAAARQPAPVAAVAKAEPKPAEPPPPPQKPAPTEKKEEPKPVEIRTAEAKPASAAPKPEPARSPETDITATVDTWLTAWSDKDMKAYLGHYAPDFDIPGGKSRKAWEAERVARIDKPGKIEVSRDKLTIRMEGADKAAASFRQHYRSSTFKSSSGKTLIMVRRDGRWLIQQERVGG
jgi:tetratricopeptide (TPR) repeat protein